MIDWNEKFRHITELLNSYKEDPKHWYFTVYEEDIPELTEYIIQEFKGEELMLANDYQLEALRTAGDNPDLLNGILGLCGEAGECAEVVKKNLFQGHPMNKEHLASELGDVAWYLAVSAYCLGYSLEDVFRINIRKLRKRYPEGFDSDHSIHRKVGDV